MEAAGIFSGFLVGLVIGIALVGTIGVFIYFRLVRKIQRLQAQAAGAALDFAKEQVVDRVTSAAGSWVADKLKTK